MLDHARRASSFGVNAAGYARHRPAYASSAIAWALEPIHQRRPLRILDVGAGTGKLTGDLLRWTDSVIAVEPDRRMAAEFRKQLPGIPILEGRAEALPLRDGSVDAVFAGQALHWFDRGRALPEIARVLTPGGVLAALWNFEDDRVDWIAELGAVSGTRCSYRAQDRKMQLPTALGGFHFITRRDFSHSLDLSHESVEALVGTSSRILTAPPDERERRLAGVRAVLRSRPAGEGSHVRLHLITLAVRGRTPALPGRTGVPELSLPVLAAPGG